jgi:hypothetical protein
MGSNLMEIFLHSFPMPIGFRRSGQANPTQFLCLYFFSIPYESKEASHECPRDRMIGVAGDPYGPKEMLACLPVSLFSPSCFLL